MKQKPEMKLSLGPEVVRHLLPHSEPFLMIDRIEAYAADPRPTLWTSRSLSINEPIFRGHFPQVALYPGALVLEGLCQTAQMSVVIHTLQRRHQDQDKDPEAILEGLRNMERGFRFDPGYSDEDNLRFRDEIDSYGPIPIGVTASVNVKFIKPVFAGERLSYRATLKRTMDDFFTFDAEATRDGQTTAKATITSANIYHPLPPTT